MINLFKGKGKKKNFIIVILMAMMLIILLLLIKNNYKKINLGNNMSNKSIEEIEEYILNISSYEAKVEVTIESNKNINKYVLEQKHIEPNKFKQTVLEPENIKNIEITYDGKSLRISNSKLNLNSIYEEHNYIADNSLFLDSFIADYKANDGTIYEEKEKIIFETKTNNDNNYRFKKKLYINKKTGTIEKLEVEDINEKTLVYILYNEIKINEAKQDDILAFKVIEQQEKLY